VKNMKSLLLAMATVLPALGLAAAGCGGEPAAGEWCESHADCDPGFYCDPETSLCSQDCVSGTGCPDDLVCNEYGQCVEEQDTGTGDPDLDPCGDPVLLVVDRSRSMFSSGNWDVIVEAVTAVVDTFDQDVDFGLLVFPDDSCTDGYSGTDLDKLCRGPDNTTVDIGPAAADSIHGSLESLGTCGGTPTSSALGKAAQVLGLLGGNIQLVLITDGLPNCNTSILIDDCECLLEEPQTCEGMTQHCLDLELSKEWAAQLLGLDTAVHVLTFGMTGDQQTLMDELAAAGGTGSAISLIDGESLGAALQTIFATITEC
jgi:hypothetical protein